jgi:hypothetical protein
VIPLDLLKVVGACERLQHIVVFPKPTNNYKTLQRELAKMDTEIVVKYI